MTKELSKSVSLKMADILTMEENQSDETRNRKNRKRKKTFLQNARKYGKKGRFGRGSQLGEDVYQYFVRILEAYKEGFENEQDKLMFVSNVFDQTVNEEVNYSRNQIGCRVIETLLPFANDDVVKRYFTALGDELRPLCSDPFASHVIQCLVKITTPKSAEFPIKVGKFLLNNLEDYVWDKYGNHIVRTVLESMSENTEKFEQYTDIVKDYAERLCEWPQFADLPYEEITSGLLQVLLQALAKIDSKLLKRVLKKLLEESFLVSSDASDEKKQEADDDLPDVFQSKPALMALEVALSVAKSKMYTQIYAKCFINRLSILAKRKDTNFAVQKLLLHCTEKTEFEAMFVELENSFEEILQSGSTGIVLALAQTCKRLAAKQGSFVQQLMKALHCFEPQERQNHFVPAVIRLFPYENLENAQAETYFVNLHGSVILQTMLQFNKPIKIVNSLLSMEQEDLKKLFCDPKGSHVVDSYITSIFVGEKSRERLARKMQGTYQDLAVSKHGSRSLEAIWKAAHLKQRMQIMDELSRKDGSWSSTQFGRIIASKLNVQLYKRSKETWKQNVDKSQKTKNLFSDILDSK